MNLSIRFFSIEFLENNSSLVDHIKSNKVLFFSPLDIYKVIFRQYIQLKSFLSFVFLKKQMFFQKLYHLENEENF